ncbi:MAG: NAD(P)-binding oxidoreductase [Planctomycetota bacterium]
MTSPSPEPLRILLLGANGRTGRQLLHRAAARGHALTAVVRSADRLTDLEASGPLPPGARARVADPCDHAQLADLLPGHDAVVSVLGPRLPTRRASRVYGDSAAAVVPAMLACDVRRLLVTSSALLFPTRRPLARVLRRLVPRIVEGAANMETRIRASDLDWTIVRTSFLDDSDGPDRHEVSEDKAAAGAYGSAVSRAAVAGLLLEELETPRRVREVVGLYGRAQ